MGRILIILVGLVGLAFYYFTNQEVNPFSGEREFNAISIPQASELGAQSYAQILQQERPNVLCLDNCQTEAAEEVVSRVREIGEKLQRAAIDYERDLLAEGWTSLPGPTTSSSPTSRTPSACRAAMSPSIPASWT